ncbi:MAG: aldolase [Sphingomonadales bacterium]|jgi:serine kinase of HPr protein (carbohydrate metabolism regulator)|nr:aldolase [Sphingomonadales bacterium]MBK9003821.1 aldolase [Sphingomonadales bacterium]MBK9268995.1 aldolase [Sphingomonadales bacterium]MBP6434410.1 aldolase [Sphingorhabdus sp.]
MTQTSPGRCLVHATAVALDGRAILLLGPSGSGKSDLALRLIDKGAILVCDDYCDIVDGVDGPQVVAKASIAGKIEIRGVGIVATPHIARAQIAMALHLDTLPDRMPQTNQNSNIVGWSIPSFAIAAFEASAPLKAIALLRLVVDARRHPVRLETPSYNRGDT